MDHNDARTRLLDAAETLFYERGIQAVGVDEIRTAATVSLKRLYQCFPSKDNLVEAYLYHRDRRWRSAMTDHVTHHAPRPADRPLAVFDWLGSWFAEPDFRGCALHQLPRRARRSLTGRHRGRPTPQARRPELSTPSSSATCPSTTPPFWPTNC